MATNGRSATWRRRFGGLSRVPSLTQSSGSGPAGASSVTTLRSERGPRTSRSWRRSRRTSTWALEHGILLEDPDEVLLGRGVTRQVRWFTFRPGDVVDAGVLAPFVVQAARIARLSRQERYALAVDRSERGVA